LKVAASIHWESIFIKNYKHQVINCLPDVLQQNKADICAQYAKVSQEENDHDQVKNVSLI